MKIVEKTKSMLNKAVEKTKRTRKENTNYNELFKNIPTEDAYKIIMDAKNSDMKVDE